MDKNTYQLIENYMKDCMKDSAHDKEHIYRVLYNALDIVQYEENTNKDILIIACLLHDIGREAQYQNSSLCHAQVGADMAFNFLCEHGFELSFAEQIRDCISSHRYRSDNQPQTIEAKILFDADKLDVTGAIGIARTLLYQGKMLEPIYALDEDNNILDGTSDKNPSFFREYNKKLKKLYDRFYTQRATQIASERQSIATEYYKCLLNEVKSNRKNGLSLLNSAIY